MQRSVPIAGATAAAVALVTWVHRRFGPDSRTFAFVAVWAPMAWLGTISRLVTPRLPDAWYRLRPVEASGRIYERLGVRAAKAMLRRGPLARFNPRLHLPGDPTPGRLRELEGRMEDAEATHVILFVATLGAAGHAAASGRRSAARWMLLWNVVMNGYPTLLQRYNRALLHARYPGQLPAGRDPVSR